MSWCALWRKTWKAWSPPEIHSYSSRWSTGMLLWCLLLVWLAISSKTTFLFLLRYWDHPVLHPNHYLVVELCHSLVFAYAVLRLVDFCSTSSLCSRRRTLSSVFRPNLSRPEQERVIQISSHILSVRTKVIRLAPSTKGSLICKGNGPPKPKNAVDFRSLVYCQ